MPNVYVEPRPKGRHIEDFVVEDHADHILASFRTQQEAIDWAKGQGHAPLVARVRPTFERQEEAGSLAVGLNVEHYRTLVASRRDDLSNNSRRPSFCE
jgi:hypothetical protein